MKQTLDHKNPNISDLRKHLQSGGYSVGSWMQLPDASVAEIMGQSGYDWVAIDLEHGRFSQSQLPDLFRALELGGTLPFARIATTHLADIKEALDAGARGLIFPMIESSEQLGEAISLSFFPPKGTRGVGYSRANLFGKHFDTYLKESQDIFIVAQIEHINAVEQLDRILEVGGLDAIMIGPYDLSASMGITGNLDHQKFVDIMKTIQEIARSKGVPMGIHVVQPDKSQLEEKTAEGYQFIAYSIDAVFLYQSSLNPIL